MDLENKFSYHFLEGLTLTEDGIVLQGNEQVYIPQKELGVLIVYLIRWSCCTERYDHRISMEKYYC